MWKGTEKILSDERAQPKNNKIKNHVNVCGTDVGDVPRCILTGSALSSKDASPQKMGQMLCWSIAADVYQIHPAFFKKNIAVASVITT